METTMTCNPENYYEDFVLPGTVRPFEYHCWESHKSCDAEIWYRSHQDVTVIKFANPDDGQPVSFDERCEAGHPIVYTVRFEDGFIGDVFEDELLDRDEWHRPDPPKRLKTTQKASVNNGAS